MIDDSSVDPRAPRWVDAFPWLKSTCDLSDDSWWLEEIDNSTPGMRKHRLEKISDLAMRRLTLWTIGQIFPGLSPELDLRLLWMLPTRAINAMTRNGFATGADLMPIALHEIMEWRNIGASTVDAILQVLADASTSVDTSLPTLGATITESKPLPQERASLPGWMPSLVADLDQIARWYATIGLPGQPVLDAQLALGTPSEVIKARQHLDQLLASDVLVTGDNETDVAALFDAAASTLDPRAASILAERFFADNAATLDEIGRRHGVTRERVRQIEGKARAAMLSFIVDDGPLAMVADAARNIIGTIRPLNDLLALIPALGKVVESFGQPAWRVLDRLDDAYEIEDGWCVAPTMQSVEAVTQTQLQEGADRHGVVRLDELNLIQSLHPERQPELTASWLAHCGYVVDGEFVFVRTQSVADYAAAVLSVAGSPLSGQEIVDRFVFERSTNSVKNAMSGDDRFERVDRDRWALKEWGMAAYAGIRSVIREQVARSGGRADLNSLVEYITGHYTVSASSVIGYASSLPFEVKDGMVQLSSGDRGTRKAPERTRRLFRRPGAWAYRIRITTDHMRGSGSVAPVAVAGILNLQSGQSRQLPSPLGPQTVAWTGIQPSFGTIRRFLMDQDIAVGTEAFLVLHDDGSFTFEAARELTGDPLSDALGLIGEPAPLDRHAACRMLASAIGLPETSPIVSIIGGYRERGDSDIADLLTSVRDHLEVGHPEGNPKRSADVEEILDLL